MGWENENMRKIPCVHIAAGVANFGFELFGSQRKKGVIIL